MLRINRVSKSFENNKKVLNDITFDINSGEIFGFIGHNGAGKTTLIKSIVGIHDFDEGEILINKKSIKSDPIACKKIFAYIPDNPDLYEYLTGIQYLNFIGDIFKVPQDVRQERIKYYADRFDLEKDIGSTIASYSHGMKQKLAIISALIHKPKLLILDEPFVGLDPKAAFTLKEIMKEFCELGGSIFFSTHVLEVAEKICNRIAIIKGGNIIAYGTTEEVKGNSSLENVFMELIDKN
ncbi:ABC transporter ATP-binding protein [Metaclostridioides mangenotii]|uniref:ABC-2 type transport system ATP-binding protein n=1 Tax=Metaclostridioides mangenotii TaxID=1540 RepID=A0ABS4E7K9_9FIRM|nr:ABC transporter ATP-binding protein [Clostridioides mangenotii]MBP1853909.1 ABC-2 type transport system ATP-binding protein [Clostridioides mangenotii]